jgi:hypothetical protein
MIDTREQEKEERKRKREKVLHCACCAKELRRVNDVYEVPGAYINTTRHKANICYQCALHPKKFVAAR